MNLFDRLQSTFPFIGGLLVLVVGAHFDEGEIVLPGLLLTLYGFYHMVRANKTQKEEEPTVITGRARRIDP